jgi:hypothetical protein
MSLLEEDNRTHTGTEGRPRVNTGRRWPSLIKKALEEINPADMLIPGLSRTVRKHSLYWHWWLAPIILATQEAEIRRITVPSHPWQIVHETLSQKYSTPKRGWWSGSSGRAPT